MDYNQAMQQIQAMQMYRRMLGLDQAQGGYGQPQSQMQYVGMGQPGQQQRVGHGLRVYGVIFLPDCAAGRDWGECNDSGNGANQPTS